jgi:hypothetical protein
MISKTDIIIIQKDFYLVSIVYIRRCHLIRTQNLVCSAVKILTLYLYVFFF